MTKEELKQKAYEYAIKEIPFIECITQNDLEILVQQAYITGAEPREKRIAELEKENAELKSDNDARKFAMAMSEKVEKQLREENTKLKTDYKVLSCSVGDFGELQDKLEEEQRKNNGLSDNLTKAKEYIKLLLMNCVGVYESTGKTIAEIQAEAEQFLNSEVEK